MSSTVSGAGGASAPSSGVASTNSNEALEGFVLLCKSSSGVQCVMVLKQVLKHPQIFVFGELLQLASIQQLSQSESASDRAWFSLLQLFAHGTWMDYQRQAKAQGLPELGPAEATKLKQLTIVDMAAKQRCLPYSLLQSSLGLSSLRALEDLLIECIHLGLIEGHLNQKDAALEVTSAMGRDIGPNDVDAMIGQLATWLRGSDGLLRTLQDQIRQTEREEAAHRALEAEAERQKKVVLDELKANKVGAPGGSASADGGPGKAKRQTKATGDRAPLGGMFSRR